MIQQNTPELLRILKPWIALATCLVYMPLMAQDVYTTSLGKSIVILDDMTYQDTVLATTSANASISPYEMPSEASYIIDNDELQLINQLESHANTEEINAYIKWVQLNKVLESVTLRESESFKRLEEQSAKAEDQLIKHKETARTIKKLRQSDAKKRKEIYESLNNNAEPNSFLTQYLNTADVEVSDLKRDTRSPFEIVKTEQCQLLFNGYDKSLDAKRKETEAAHFFGYTNERLQRHFTDTDYIQSDVSLAKIDDDYYISLEIDIASKSASTNYGSLQPSQKTRMRFVDGSTIYLQPISAQLGTLQNYTGHTVYNPIYQLNKDQIKTMEKVEIDDIGLMWSSGFENYEIYEVDILQKLVKCLKR